MDYKKILITGAAGFIGSHLAEYLFNKYKKTQFVLYDKVTYAANKKYLKNILKDKRRVKFIKKDLVDFKEIDKSLKGVDLAINVAAESHVDNSFGNSLLFTKTNTLGAHTFFEACRKNKTKNIVHVSTDEVYGENIGNFYSENQILNPTNPYSASKAGADMMAISYQHSFNLPIKIIRANNIYGIRQYPEKLISKTIYNFIKNKSMTIHGDGNYYRYFLSVYDLCSAIDSVIKKGKIKNIYNVASKDMFKITAVIKNIAKLMNKNFVQNIIYTKNRPFNDRIYKISCKKLLKLGWKQKNNLIKDLPAIIEWYNSNYKIFKQ